MWLKIVMLILLTLIVQHIIRVVLNIHTFQVTFNHAPGICKRLPSITEGSEDAEVLPNGLVYISSGFGRKSGKLFKFDFTSGLDDVEEFAIEGKFDLASFRPHGISFWRDPKTGVVTLFVISHNVKGERVEVFHHDGTKKSKVLKYIRTIQDPKITILNDLVATGPDSFYASIFYTYNLFFDFLLMYPGGGLLHYDNGKTTVLDSGIGAANGINISPDKRFLYLSEIGYGNIIFYKINDDKTVKKTKVFYTGTFVDNINVDAKTGDLWVGSHPNTFLAVKFLNTLDSKDKSPSQVLKISVKEDQVIDVREVYANNGTEILASSVAVPYKNKLLIGTVAEGALLCDVTCNV